MKKALILSVVFSISCLVSFAQSILNPQVGTQDDGACKITKIETDKLYTAVTFEAVAGSDSAWVQLNKEIYIQTDVGNAHYNYVKSENIPMVPQPKHLFKKAGDKLEFKVYFQKIPPASKTIDVIERAGNGYDGSAYFNFYNVSLTESEITPKTIDGKIIGPGGGFGMPLPDGGGTGSDPFGGMGGIGGMYKNMMKGIMDAQISYYKEPGKMAELAKLNKQYFDALVKEGFTEDQALKLVAASGLGPKSGMGDK
ncbi:hypothetical protein [Mucilaginibacter psychrotolerans]|uniref:DUF4384 domain-containing protein n=1 Tax=Mucilaginibacter psychrotolerans TaxID=1524096 RepID=A0A4Y8SEJ7_9SPHI|nr:hypothetical protein [Mucilaginibacter psychrotolerans]TFF37308.1 hypothetical protein E2R66_12805 [Mucilaginibacter psychrotolerans]